MAHNIEIKARLHNPARQAELAAQLSGAEPERIGQVDVFFHCTHGRLKLRKFEDGTGTLIAYQRTDQSGPKLSDYILSHTSEPDSLQAALERAHGIDTIVEKVRMLSLVGQTRIHIDRVAQLGDFLELEVVLQDSDTHAWGEQVAQDLMAQLEVAPEDLIECAYVDLLKASQVPS